MSYTPKILAFSGSARKDSFNTKLLHLAAEAARRAGAEVTVLDMREYPLPLYDGDLEAAEGLPAQVKELKKIFLLHDGLLIASPEYNSSFTPLLKNLIDWVSRAEKGEGGLVAYKGKVAGLISASPGALGGLRGLVHLRQVLGNIGVIVIPEQKAVASAIVAFGADGSLQDVKTQEAVEGVAKALVGVVSKLNAVKA